MCCLAGAGLQLVRQQLRHGALGHVPAGVDDVDVVGEALGVVHEVGGQDDPHAAVAEFGDELEHELAGLRVQAGARFVQEEDLGVAGQGSGEGEALLLPAGQAADRGAAEAVDAQAPDQVLDRPRVLVHAGDVRKQRNRAGRRREPAVLEHHADAGPESGAGRIRVLAEQADAARRCVSAGPGRTRWSSSCRRRWPPAAR